MSCEFTSIVGSRYYFTGAALSFPSLSLCFSFFQKFVICTYKLLPGRKNAAFSLYKYIHLVKGFLV